MTQVLLLLLGLAGLVAGSELLVRAARRIAARLGVSTLVVGLTIASIGTSVPEIATNVTVGFNAIAGAADASGVAVGNILGSCLAQVTLLLGIAGFARGLGAPTSAREGIAVVGAMLGAALASADGVVERWEGLVLVGVYVGYVVLLVRSGPDEEGEAKSKDAPQPTDVRLDAVQAVAGLVLLGVCAHVVVTQAVASAAVFGLSETTVGVFVGLGTGLPELAVALSAIFHRDEAMAMGNLLGSNITDPLLSFGLGAVVHPVTVPVGELVMDFVFWVGGTVVALLLLRSQRRLDREESAVLLVIFAMYLSLRWFLG